MKKQSLVHVHGLLTQIRSELQNCGEVPGDAYRGYEERNVSPMSIHRGKDAHREAIDLLGDGILRTIDHQRDGNEPEKTDLSLPSGVDDWKFPDR
ncbi:MULTISPECIES: UPF0058 family protein [Natrialbaceae]|uniref:UPF0058 family protein n=1 Tax=Natrialbaceae TaxID=1644061 RepID=UPI00207C8787|nr:UPF0058 family protein [Natronococcus sp. CG52]